MDISRRMTFKTSKPKCKESNNYRCIGKRENQEVTWEDELNEEKRKFHRECTHRQNECIQILTDLINAQRSKS